MKMIACAIVAIMFSTSAYSQDSLQVLQTLIDSVEKSFIYERGTIQLPKGNVKINVPNGYKYLNPAQAKKVLHELWGNPENSSSLGLILPESSGVLDEESYVFNIEYSEIGYIEDHDVDEIDYDELMLQMVKDAEEESKERRKSGEVPFSILGWATKPFYNKEKKVLHWAKEIKFQGREIHTLNYNIVVLGRKGIIVLNAISTMPLLPLVQRDIHKIVDVVQFNNGNRYEDFDSSVDNVAALTLGGLVAGKVLTKVGFFALLLKFWKVIAVFVVGFFGSIWKKMRGVKEDVVESNP